VPALDISTAHPAVAATSEKARPLRFIDWIWHIRGSIPLAPGQSADAAFTRLDPLFAQPDTTCERTGDTLTFIKKNQLAQDKMSVFDSGVLHIEQAPQSPVLRYNLVSRALLFCFLAPLLFLGIAQMTVALGQLEKPKAEEKAKKPDEKKDKAVELNPVDKFLGAPAPEKPEDKKAKDKKKGEDDEDKGFSPTPAYVFAGIFSALYGLGRILEAWLIRRLFAKTLA